MANSITQEMRYRQSLMKYADKYGVSQAPEIQQESVVHLFLAGTLGRKCGIPGLSVPAATQSPQPAYRGGTETDPGYAPQKSNTWNGGTMASVETAGLHPPPKQQKPYKPKPYERITFLGQRVQVDVKVVPRRCIADPELRLYLYTAIDEFIRLRFLTAYPEQSTYSSADFLKRLTKWYARRAIRVECVQTENGFEFTNRFSNSKRDLPTLFETTAAKLGIQHKLIRPYTPRHNGKVERSHREDQKRFYTCHSFYSLDDFAKQLAVHNRRSNNFPMRPLNWLSPLEFTVQYV